MAQRHLAEKRILIVEDSWPIARHIAAVLTAHGAVVLGPVISAADADRVLQRSQPDCIVIDEKLEREAGSALALVLRQRGIPMLVVGHSRHRAPPDPAGRRHSARPAVMSAPGPGTATPPPCTRQPSRPPSVSVADLVWKSSRAIEDSFELLARIRELEARQARLMRQWRLQRDGSDGSAGSAAKPAERIP